MMLPLGLVLMVGFAPLVWTVSPPDYSNAKEPVILFTLTHLEAARPSLTYDTSTVPATNGLVELHCELILETVRNTLSYGNATLKWVVPNSKIIKENRAFAKVEDKWGSSIATLAITQFKAEDAGDYSCQLYVDGTETQYKQTINIPALDGSPLLKCDLTCTRNENEDCQVMEYVHIPCEAYGFPRPNVRCSVDDCETEQSCPPPRNFLHEPSDAFGTRTSIYSKVHEKVFDEYALKSGRFFCEAINGKSTASASVFVPVSAGVEKTSRPPLPPGLAGASSPQQQENPLFIAKKTPHYYAIGERVTLICWTNDNVGPIEWAFYNASTPHVKEPMTNASHAGLFFTNEEGAGGYASKIVIYAATLQHGGIYECSATNKQDGSRRSAQLVMETYRWAADADMNQDRQLSTRTGSTVTMKCTVVTTKEDPRVGWLKDGLYLETNERIQKSTDQQTLTIKSATPEDSGVYTCQSQGRFALGVDDLEGKTTLVVTDTGLLSEQVSSINNAITSLFTVQQTLMALSESFSRP